MTTSSEHNAATSAGRKVVLFLDDSPEYLEILQRVMGVWSREEWEILTAGDTGEALKTLEARAVDVVVIDLHMPVVDGAQFLQMLQSSHPGVRKVILTGCGEDNLRAACLDQGAELFLEKPRTTTGLEIVYQTLRQLLSTQRQEGFRGLLRRVSLPDIVQLECLNRSSSVLEIGDGRLRGAIYIHRGNIVHAEAGAQSGADAFRVLMRLRGGDFTLKPYVTPARQTIAGSWEGLLLDAAQSLDELGASSCTTTANCGASTRRYQSATWLRHRERDEADPLRASRPTSRSAAPESPPPSPEAPRRGKPEVKHLLVLEADGRVVHSLGPGVEAARKPFLAHLQAPVSRLAASLALGEPLTLEASNEGGRWVVRWEGTRTTFADAIYKPSSREP